MAKVGYTSREATILLYNDIVDLVNRSVACGSENPSAVANLEHILVHDIQKLGKCIQDDEFSQEEFQALKASLDELEQLRKTTLATWKKEMNDRINKRRY